MILPHLIVEYSENFESDIDIAAFMQKTLAEPAITAGISFGWGITKLIYISIADLAKENAFFTLTTVRIGKMWIEQQIIEAEERIFA